MTEQLTWLGGNPGDGWYEISDAIVTLLNQQSSTLQVALVAGGGEENLSKIHAGEADLGMSIDIVASAAYNGASPFDAPMRTINSLGVGWSPLPYNLLKSENATSALQDAIIEPGLRIGAPPQDTTDELTFQRVLAYYGFDYRDVARRGGRVLLDGYDALVVALQAGEIDYLFGATTMPADSIAKAAAGDRHIGLVELPTDLIDHLARRYGCSRGTIPAKTYPGLQHTDIATAFVDTTIVVSADLPDTAALEITRLLLGNPQRLAEIHPSLDRFNPFTAWRNVPAPIHPGAARAYREMGFMS
jgi:TRAP transporter TAXI family solute receptor